MSKLLDAYRTLPTTKSQQKLNPKDVAFAGFVVGLVAHELDDGCCPETHRLFPHQASFSEFIDWMCNDILYQNVGDDPYSRTYWGTIKDKTPFRNRLNWMTHERLVNSKLLHYLDDAAPSVIFNLPWRTLTLDVLTMPWGAAKYNQVMLAATNRSPDHEGVPGMWWMLSKYGNPIINALLNAHKKTAGQQARAKNMFEHYKAFTALLY